MRALIISVFCRGVLVTGWGAYDIYSDAKIDVYVNEIENNIIFSIEHDDWETAETAFDRLSDDWHKYKKISTFFFDRRILNETDYSIARTKYYIKANDLSNATGELAYLKEQFAFFHSNESFNLENIL
jgi:hypothetical protein